MTWRNSVILCCLSSCSHAFHHLHAAGEPQQLLQPLDLHVLRRTPLPGPQAELSVLLIALPQVLAVSVRARLRLQSQEQLLHLRHQEHQQPEEHHANVLHIKAAASRPSYHSLCTSHHVLPLRYPAVTLPSDTAHLGAFYSSSKGERRQKINWHRVVT